MDQRHAWCAAVLLVALLSGGLALAAAPAAHASLRIDFDAGRASWRNDGDPRIIGRRGGALRSLGREEVLADPLTAKGVLRFPACRALPAAVRGDCAARLLPAGPPQRALAVPLDRALREAYLPLWEKAPPLVAPEQVQLEQAMQTLVRQLSGSIHLRDIEPLLEPVGEAARRAEAVPIAPALVASVRRTQAMVEVLGELWRFRNTHASRDLNLPCDRLQNLADRFNQAAGSSAVRLYRQRPAGICLFCGNVCTPQTADRLLADMKEAVILTLVEGSGQAPTEAPDARATEAAPEGR
jgi:hypothetical protein